MMQNRAEQTGEHAKLGIITDGGRELLILVAEFFRTRRQAVACARGLGLNLRSSCAEFLMFHGVEPAATYLIRWPGRRYILLADAAAFAITGHSRLREEARGFLKMVRFGALVAHLRSYPAPGELGRISGLPAGRVNSCLLAWVVATDHAAFL